MKKTSLLIALVIAASAVLLGIPNSTPAAKKAGDVFTLRMQHAHTPGFLTYSIVEQMVNDIKVASGGRLIIELYPSGALVPGGEVLEAVSQGTLDAYWSGAGYFDGQLPGNAYFSSGAYGMNGEDMQTWLYEGGGLEKTREVYLSHGYNVHVVGSFGHGIEPINSKIPLRTIEDVVGTKGRMGGGIYVEVVKALGGKAVNMPTGEAYTNLQTGVIDWADAGDMVSNWNMGLHEVAPYLIFCGWNQGGSQMETTVNMDVWKSLPDDLKQIMEICVRAASARLREQADWGSAQTMEKLKEYGVEIIVWDEAELAKVAKIVKDIEATPEWQGRSEDGLIKWAVDSQAEFWETFGPYKFSVLTKRPNQ